MTMGGGIETGHSSSMIILGGILLISFYLGVGRLWVLMFCSPLQSYIMKAFCCSFTQTIFTIFQLYHNDSDCSYACQCSSDGHSPVSASHVIPQWCAENNKWFMVRKELFTFPCFIQINIWKNVSLMVQ